MSQNNHRSQRGKSGRRGGGPGKRPGRKSAAPAGPPPEPLHPTENPPDIESFAEFDLQSDVQDAIAAMGIVKPTPIQALAIGPVLEGKDVIAKAETGTGKTLAFGAPMISMIDPERSSVLGLVLAPTRELADQVKVVLEQLGESRGIKVALIVGGEPAGPQVAALQAGAQVVVGTPGRVIDLYEQKFLSFPWTEFVVLDEADEMFEIGFVDDVKKIMRFTPDERQTLLFSATFPPALLRLARDATKDPAEIATASGVKTVDNIEQVFIRLGADERPLALIRMIERSAPEDVFLIFCERRTDVERLMRRLERLPFSVKALHGGYDQSARFRVMSAFRTGEVKALVATDVASRGLDVNHVTRVVNYSPPRSITDYTHRIGRTGRAGREGHAVTLVAPEGNVRWNSLMRDATWDIPEVDAPGSRFNPGPRRGERDDSDSREERPRRARRDENESEDSEAREERPRRPRREESDRGGRRDRNRDRDQAPDRDRGPDRDRDRDRDGDRESATASPESSRRVRRAQPTDAPVELPSKSNLRKRDPNDPPRRVRMTREMRERLEREESDRGGRVQGEDRDRGRSRDRGDRNRSRGDRDEASEPRRDRSRSRGDREDRPDGDEPRRDRSRSRSRSDRDDSRTDRTESRSGRSRDERPRDDDREDSARPRRDRSRGDRDDSSRNRDSSDEPRRDRSRSRSREGRDERPRESDGGDSDRPRRDRSRRNREDTPRDREDHGSDEPRRGRARQSRDEPLPSRADARPTRDDRSDAGESPRKQSRSREDRGARTPAFGDGASEEPRRERPRKKPQDSPRERSSASSSNSSRAASGGPSPAKSTETNTPKKAERPAPGGGFGSGI